MIRIAFLSDYPDTIPTLARWFRDQWPDYYAGRTLTDIERDFLGEAQRQHLPVRLVALVDEELAGTIVLRDRAIPTRSEYHPGLGGLFVPVRFRTRGIGTELVRSGMVLARNHGYGVVYATTVVAGEILKRLGWSAVKAVIVHEDEHLTLYRCELK